MRRHRPDYRTLSTCSGCVKSTSEKAVFLWSNPRTTDSKSHNHKYPFSAPLCPRSHFPRTNNCRHKQIFTKPITKRFLDHENDNKYKFIKCKTSGNNRMCFRKPGKKECHLDASVSSLIFVIYGTKTKTSLARGRKIQVGHVLVLLQ